MSNINKDIYSLNQSESLRVFNEEGVFLNRVPVAEVEQFSILGVQTNTNYNWDFSAIGFAFKPKTLFGYNGAGLTGGDDLFIRVIDIPSGQEIWELNLKGNINVLGDAFFFEFPYLIVSTKHIVQIRTDESLTNLIIFGEKAYLNEPPHTPTFIN